MAGPDWPESALVMAEEAPSADVMSVRDGGALVAAFAASAGVAPSKAALGLLIAACDQRGAELGFEHVAGWLRLMAETYEQNYPVDRPDGAIVH